MEFPRPARTKVSHEHMPKTARNHIARLRSFVGYDDVGTTLLKLTHAAADLQSAGKGHLDTLSAMRTVASTHVGLPKDMADIFIEGMARAVAERALRIGRTLAKSGNAAGAKPEHDLIG